MVDEQRTPYRKSCIFVFIEQQTYRKSCNSIFKAAMAVVCHKNYQCRLVVMLKQKKPGNSLFIATGLPFPVCEGIVKIGLKWLEAQPLGSIYNFLSLRKVFVYDLWSGPRSEPPPPPRDTDQELWCERNEPRIEASLYSHESRQERS